MPRVVVSDHEAIRLDVVRDELEPDVSVDPQTIRTPEDVARAAETAAGVILLKTPITADVMERTTELRVVGQCSIGVDHVDLPAARREGIEVVNVPSYCLEEVSTHAMTLLLACVRNVLGYHRSVVEGEWEWRVGPPISRLSEGTLGLAAFGDIPRHVSRKAQSFGLDVVAYDPYVDEATMREYDIRKVSFEELLTTSDYISAHVPLTEESRHLFDERAFRQMSEDVVFVNTGRGPVVDQDALYEALVQGEIRAAGLDVLAEEPPTESPLFDLDNVVLTPHVAFYSEHSLERRSRAVAADVRRVLTGESPQNPATRSAYGKESQ